MPNLAALPAVIRDIAMAHGTISYSTHYCESVVNSVIVAELKAIDTQSSLEVVCLQTTAHNFATNPPFPLSEASPHAKTGLETRLDLDTS